MDPPRPKLPPARNLTLAGRGRTWVYDTGDPPIDAATNVHADGEPPARGSGPAVVLLHGWTSTAALNWHRCFGPLSATHRVVALDQRGHGRGIRSRRPFRLEECADDAAALIRCLGLGPSIVVGYSMGGPIAQLLWRRHPDCVRGLILCATAARFSSRRDLAGMMGVAAYGVSLAISGVPFEIRRRGVGYVLRSRAPESGMSPWAIEESERNDPAAMIQAGLALSRFDSTSWVGRIDVPTAVIVTTLDTTVSPSRQRRLGRLIPGSVTLDVDGTHRACVDEAKLFLPALRSACDAVGSGPRVQPSFNGAGGHGDGSRIEPPGLTGRSLDRTGH